MSDSYSEQVQAVEASLDQGDIHAAFQGLRGLMRWPNLEASDWGTLWSMFARVSEGFAGETFATMVQRAADNPQDIEAGYTLGYELVEQGLHDLAASALQHTWMRAPGHDGVASEYVHALETLGYNAEAVTVLQHAALDLEHNFILRYLLGFNALMANDVPLLRATVRDLRPQSDDERFMAARLVRMLERHDHLAQTQDLDHRDLRAWHAVTQAAVVLHLSPHGFDEGMHGRYAFVQDSYALIKEGLLKLEAVLESWRALPPRVYALPERSSRIVAAAAAKHFGVELVDWPDEGTQEPGLIAAYDINLLEGEVIYSLVGLHAGQPLWAHATCWTEVPPISPDLTTMLYQQNIAPWAGQLFADPETMELREGDADARHPDAIADELLAASLDDDALEDTDTLRALAQSFAELKGEHGPVALRQEGQRGRFWECSPVKSNRFY